MSIKTLPRYLYGYFLIINSVGNIGFEKYLTKIQYGSTRGQPFVNSTAALSFEYTKTFFIRVDTECSAVNSKMLDIFKKKIKRYFFLSADGSCVECSTSVVLNDFLIQCFEYSCFLHVVFVLCYIFYLPFVCLNGCQVIDNK